MKTKISFLIVFLLWAFIVLIGCQNGAIHLPEGLTLSRIDSAKGVLEGSFTSSGRTVYFEAHRGEKNPVLGRILEGWTTTPPYTIEACFISQEGEAFITADYCSRNEVHEIEDSLRPQDFRLSWKAADALERTKLPYSLYWEKKTLIQMARSIREEDLHRDFTPE